MLTTTLNTLGDRSGGPSLFLKEKTMTDKPDPVLQLLSASTDILTMFNDNLILHRIYEEPLRNLAKAIDGVTETYNPNPKPTEPSYNPINRSGNL